jgi:ATP-dependent Clp protease ATP-binding subunit ClpX
LLGFEVETPALSRFSSGMSEPTFPSPEEFQRKMAEFLRTGFHQKPEAEFQSGPSSGPEKTQERDVLEFSKSPKEVKRHLDRFVIRQEDAKKVLAIALCDHYNHVRRMRELEESDPEKARAVEHTKQNVILLGPTGVGKTYLVRHAADLIGVPFVKADATKFSETGYVGGDVEDLVRELLRKADGDVRLAQYGIVYIDEVDKIASVQGGSGRDVSGRGVQTALLKLMEETEVPARNPMDLQAQIQAAMSLGRGGKPPAETINTRHILFIVSGAFDRLRSQIEKRLRNAAVGFLADSAGSEGVDPLRQVRTSDLVDYGLEPEFVGRLPVRVVCEELSADDLFDILRLSEGSILRQYERAFEAYGIKVEFKEDGMREIAKMAAAEGTGARGLVTVCERVFRDFKYELPGSGVEEFVVTEALVKDPAKTLEDLLRETRAAQLASAAADIAAFAESFQSDEGVPLRIMPDAADIIARRALEEGRTVRALCEALFHDYPYGLRLLKASGRLEPVEIHAEAINAPDQFLSDLVARAYGQNPGDPAGSAQS